MARQRTRQVHNRRALLISGGVALVMLLSAKWWYPLFTALFSEDPVRVVYEATLYEGDLRAIKVGDPFSEAIERAGAKGLIQADGSLKVTVWRTQESGVSFRFVPTPGPNPTISTIESGGLGRSFGRSL
ncbi:MAG: hypothetical protein PF961_09840 [Planctomycetota bacterium]|jgi:hypothetical protein|nr:hypothetical protein [Planctomycetota bacterium]